MLGISSLSRMPLPAEEADAGHDAEQVQVVQRAAICVTIWAVMADMDQVLFESKVRNQK